MKRELIPINKIKMNSPAHSFLDGETLENGEIKEFTVNQKVDGKSHQEHIDGIEYIRTLIKDGVKIMPPLVQRLDNGMFKKLDGFKRIIAHNAECTEIIEAFVCEPEDMGKEFNYNDKKLVCKGGGQSYRRFDSPVEYGEAINQKNGAGKINWLYYKKGSHLRIEYREAIHLHWGNQGRYRLMLGRRDFDLLADAFEHC